MRAAALDPDDTDTQFDLGEALYAAGIGCSVHYIPLHLHPYWQQRYDLQPEQFPHSQKAYERMLSLPLYTRMSEADTDRVIAAVRKALGR